MGEIIFKFHQFVDNKFIKDRKVLLLGSSGALGRELDAQLKALKIPVLSTSRSNFDIEDSKKNILEMLLSENIYLVLNCLAMTGLDACYKDRKSAFLINYLFPKKIADICEILNIKLVHFSTDNVFSCDRMRYTYREIDPPNPLTWYGATKFMGELAISSLGQKIIRLPMMFGPTNDKQLIAKLLNNAAQGVTIKVADDVYSTPIYTPYVANWICNRIVSNEFWDEKIIHLSGDTLINLSDFTSRIIECLNLKCKIESVSSEIFPVLEYKPKYGGLKSKVENTFSFDDSVIEYSNFLMRRSCFDK